MTSFQETIAKSCDELGLPKLIKDSFLPFCINYETSIKPARPPLDTFLTFLQLVAKQLKSPHQFAPYHEAIRAPFDYYKLGLDFIRPLIDFAQSEVRGKIALQEITDKLQRKENVVLLSNHQTEIDPQIISLLLEKEYPQLAENMIFVAGHRVTTDPMAVPLSLGRNLICIYSKRHVEHPPEKKAEKLQHNQRALKRLEELFSEGGKCIYIAPSGGRDRRNEKGRVEVAPFDPDSVEMFYLLSKRAKRPTHFHTLTLLTYPLLPPPDQVLVEIGEARNTTFAPAKLTFSPEIDMEGIGNTEKIQDKREKRKARTDAIFSQVTTDFAAF